jgi:hypothetical protein
VGSPQSSRFGLCSAPAQFALCGFELGCKAYSSIQFEEEWNGFTRPKTPSESNFRGFLLNSILYGLTWFYPRRLSELNYEVCASHSIRNWLLGFTLIAVSELTREVCLCDQSEAHSKSSRKCAQVLFGRNTVEICACLCKKTVRQQR